MYTNLEIQVLEACKLATDESQLLCVHAINNYCNLGTNVIRGVVTSLVKKGALFVDEGEKHPIHILNEEYQGATYEEE